MAAFIRALPVFDAFADIFTYHTPFPKLFVGKDYTVELPAPMAQEVNIPTDSPSPLINFYTKLEKIAEASPKLRSYVPELGVDWDTAKVMEHRMRYINDYAVCIVPSRLDNQRSLPNSWLSLKTIECIGGRVAMNVVTSLYTPRIRGAYQLVNDDESKHPDLLEMMRYISACSKVVTTVVWGIDLAVGYGVPVDYISLRPWRNPYDLRMEVMLRDKLDHDLGYRITPPPIKVHVYQCPNESSQAG